MVQAYFSLGYQRARATSFLNEAAKLREALYPIYSRGVEEGKREKAGKAHMEPISSFLTVCLSVSLSLRDLIFHSGKSHQL